MVNICLVCSRICKSKANQYNELISSIYPKETDSYAVKGIGNFINYALANIERLPAIGTVIEKRIKADLEGKRYGHVVVGFKIFDALIGHAHTDISLFRLNIENTLKLIVNKDQHNVISKVSGIETLTKFILQIEESMITSLLPCIEEVISCLKYTNKEEKDQLKLRFASLRCIGKICTKVSFFATDKVLPIVYGMLSNIYDVNDQEYEIKPQSEQLKIKDLFEKDLALKVQDIREISAECLFSFSKNLNISTIPPFLQSIFKFFDENDYWKTPFPTGIVKLLFVQGGWKNNGFTIVSQLINHIDNINSIITKISIIKIVTLVIEKQSITGTVGPQALEALTSIVRLLYKSNGEKEFQESLFQSISTMAKRSEHSEQNLSMFGSILSIFKKTQNDFDCEMLLKTMNEISIHPSTVPEGKFYPDNIVKPLLDEIVNKQRKKEVRILLLKILQQLQKSGIKKEENNNKTFATFSKKQRDEIQYFLFNSALFEDNSSELLAGITINFLLLLNQYRSKDLDQSIPIIFRLQELCPPDSIKIHTLISLYFIHLGSFYNNTDLLKSIDDIIQSRIKDKEISNEIEKLASDQVPTEEQLVNLFNKTELKQGKIEHLFDKEKMISILSKIETIRQAYPNNDVKELFTTIYSDIFKPNEKKKEEENPFYDIDEHTDDLSRKQSSLDLVPVTEESEVKLNMEDVLKINYFDLGQKSQDRKQQFQIKKNKLLEIEESKIIEEEEILSDDENKVEKEEPMIDESLSKMPMPQLQLFNMLTFM